MYISTRGIVFRQTKFSDTSLVVKILTEVSGMGSYIVKGARGPKAKIKASLFQPLTLLDLVVSNKEKSDLHHIREARVNFPYQNIHHDIRKSSILLFLNELLYKSIQEESTNPELFNYIYEQLIVLDQTTENPACFHLSFAIQLTRYLGFFPQGIYLDERNSFDLIEGYFVNAEPLPEGNFISGNTCAWFSRLIDIPTEKFFVLGAPAAVRTALLEKILLYYQHHLPLSGEFKSHIVLHQVLQ